MIMYKTSLEVKLSRLLYLNNLNHIRFLTDDHYRTLDVGRNSTQKEIKSAYYKLSKKYHPDVNKEKDAEHKFKEIQAAYDVLGDEIQKETYDRSIYENQYSGSNNNSTSYQNYNSKTNYSNIHNPYNIRKNKWHHKSTKMHTGKTSMYDFDEYYRMHYNDMRQRRQEEIRKEEELQIKWKQYKQEYETNKNDIVLVASLRRSLFLLITFMTVIFVTFIKYLQKREEEISQMRGNKLKSK